MTRNVCWTFTPIAPGQSVYIVTCPRLIKALLNPVVEADDQGSYGPYVDRALSANDADDSPGIFRGIAISAPAPQDLPFVHALVTVEIHPERLPVLTGPLFDAEMKALDAHYLKFPWKKPLPTKRGQSPLDELLEGVLGEKAALFQEIPDAELADAGKTTQDFLGIVLVEDEASKYLLKVITNLLLYEIMLTTFLEIDHKKPF